MTLGVLFDSSEPYMLRQHLLFESRAHILANLASQLAVGILHICFTRNGITGRLPYPPGIYMGNVFQILAIMFVLQALGEQSSQPKFHIYKELNLASNSEDFGSGFWASEENTASDG